MHDLGSAYDKAFYEANEDGSLRAARVVLGLLFDVLRAGSVIDVGCGIGTWLRVASDLGARPILGVDGPHIDRRRLLFSPYSFIACDLEDENLLLYNIHERRFDLAMSLEVAEHLTAPSAEGFVRTLAAISDMVLWSAALPGQGGTHHVNEQPLTFWSELWRRAGYVPVDLLRPALQFAAIDVWYQQNVILFVKAAAAPRVRAAFDAYYDRMFGYVPPLGFVHPRTLGSLIGPTDQGIDEALERIAPLFKSEYQVAIDDALLDLPQGSSALRDTFSATEQVEFRWNDRLAMLGWMSRQFGNQWPTLLLLSTDQMTLRGGLYFPVWASSAENVEAVRRSCLTGGLVWDDPLGWRLDGWSEIAKRAGRPLLSLSLLGEGPNRPAIRRLAREAATLWLEFALSHAAG